MYIVREKMNIDNVVPLYDLFEGNLYALWQRVLIFGSIGFVIALSIYLYIKSKRELEYNEIQPKIKRRSKRKTKER